MKWLVAIVICVFVLRGCYQKLTSPKIFNLSERFNPKKEETENTDMKQKNIKSKSSDEFDEKLEIVKWRYYDLKNNEVLLQNGVWCVIGEISPYGICKKITNWYIEFNRNNKKFILFKDENFAEKQEKVGADVS